MYINIIVDKVLEILPELLFSYCGVSWPTWFNFILLEFGKKSKREYNNQSIKNCKLFKVLRKNRFSVKESLGYIKGALCLTNFSLLSFFNQTEIILCKYCKWIWIINIVTWYGEAFWKIHFSSNFRSWVSVDFENRSLNKPSQRAIKNTHWNDLFKTNVSLRFIRFRIMWNFWCFSSRPLTWFKSCFWFIISRNFWVHL